jgi:hypothetical protein
VDFFITIANVINICYHVIGILGQISFGGVYTPSPHTFATQA